MLNYLLVSGHFLGHPVYLSIIPNYYIKSSGKNKNYNVVRNNGLVRSGDFIFAYLAFKKCKIIQSYLFLTVQRSKIIKG